MSAHHSAWLYFPGLRMQLLGCMWILARELREHALAMTKQLTGSQHSSFKLNQEHPVKAKASPDHLGPEKALRPSRHASYTDAVACQHSGQRDMKETQQRSVTGQAGTHANGSMHKV